MLMSPRRCDMPRYAVIMSARCKALIYYHAAPLCRCRAILRYAVYFLFMLPVLPLFIDIADARATPCHTRFRYADRRHNGLPSAQCHKYTRIPNNNIAYYQHNVVIWLITISPWPKAAAKIRRFLPSLMPFVLILFSIDIFFFFQLRYHY